MLRRIYGIELKINLFKSFKLNHKVKKAKTYRTL